MLYLLLLLLYISSSDPPWELDPELEDREMESLLKLWFVRMEILDNLIFLFVGAYNKLPWVFKPGD